MKYAIQLQPAGVIPRDPNVGIRMQRLPPTKTIEKTVTVEVPGPGGGGCTPVEGFTWPTLAADIDAANATTTYLDTTLDNVSLHFKFGGPLTRWEALSGSATKISGALGNTGSPGSFTYRPILLEVTGDNQPRQPLSGTTNATDVSANPAYAALNSAVLAGYEIDPATLDGDQVLTFPGVAATGNQVYFQGEATTDPLWFEAWLSRNPGATNTTKGYSGFTVFQDLSFFSIDNAAAAVVFDDLRIGFFDVDADVSDAAFDGTTMRCGIWAVPDGAGAYKVRMLVNGAIISTHTTPVTAGMFRAAFNPAFSSPPGGSINGQIQIEPIHSLTVDGENFTGGSGTYYAILARCWKFGIYLKPNASNTASWQILPTLSLATNPAYAL